MELTMADNFESRFFDLLQKNLDDLGNTVQNGFQQVNSKVDLNIKTTNKVIKRVDRLDGKVFQDKPRGTLAGLLQDKQIILYFIAALFVFLLILASVLKVTIPSL